MSFKNGIFVVFLAFLVGCSPAPTRETLAKHDTKLEVLLNFPRHAGRLKFKFFAIDNGEEKEIGNINLRTNMTIEHTKTISFQKPDKLEGLLVTLHAKSTVSLEAYYCLYEIPIADSGSHYYKYQLGFNSKGSTGQCWWRKLK